MTLGPDARIVSSRRLHGGLSSVAHALAIGRNTETFGAVLKRPEVWVEDIVECFNRIGSQLTEPAVAETLNSFVVQNPL